MTELHLPYPPSANRLWRKSRHGMYRDKKYQQWLEDAAKAARDQRPGAVFGRYKLSIQAVRPDRRKRDLDNLLKATSDLLVSVGVIEDDSDCDMIVARWVTTGDGILVRVEPVGTEP